MKKALLTGITGQDGAYLAKLLLEKGYEVFGIYRRLSTPNFWRLQTLGIFERVTLIPADLLDMASVIEAVRISAPDEIYNLAAQSSVGASFEQPIEAGEITGLGVTRILEAIRILNSKARFYQASTSELFGNGTDSPQLEETPFDPVSPYAVAKLYGFHATKVYREGYGMFACNGILFNHESPLRGLEFVTRKVTNAVAKIYWGLQDELSLGRLDTRRDWGYAPDFVEAMWMMMQHSEPSDLTIATNETHSVEELCKKAFEVAGLNWHKYIELDKRFERPRDVYYLQGNYTRATKTIGWKPKVKFDKLVQIMVEADIDRWKRWKRGESFPWDAANYPNENKMVSRMLELER